VGAVFNPLFQGFADLVAFFYKVIPSYGVAIVLLTVAVRLVLFPLTAKQAKSMQAMQRVQPELKRLQTKYKSDRQKLNEEMMKFYKENQINPLAGCLPLVLQLPLFIVLYRVIAGLAHTSHGKPSPKYIAHDTSLYHALLRSGGKMVSWGLDLARSASQSTHKGFGTALPYFVLVALVVATGYYQQRQMTARTPASAQNQQAQMMGKIFPVMFGFISYNIQAGVVVYFIVSNIWQIGQQALIFRKAEPGTGGGAGQVPAKPKAPPKAGGDGNGAQPAGAKPRQPAKRKRK
jgi:YidC/Oxa1 family membrane protein insertase